MSYYTSREILINLFNSNNVINSKNLEYLFKDVSINPLTNLHTIYQKYNIIDINDINRNISLLQFISINPTFNDELIDFCINYCQNSMGYVINNSLKGECAICLEDFKQDTITLHCNHSFHKECFDTSYEVNPLCPYCRSPLKKMDNYAIWDITINIIFYNHSINIISKLFKLFNFLTKENFEDLYCDIHNKSTYKYSIKKAVIDSARIDVLLVLINEYNYNIILILYELYDISKINLNSKTNIFKQNIDVFTDSILRNNNKITIYITNFDFSKIINICGLLNDKNNTILNKIINDNVTLFFKCTNYFIGAMTHLDNNKWNTLLDKIHFHDCNYCDINYILDDIISKKKKNE